VARRVIVVASGETERRSLPKLLTRLLSSDVLRVEVRIPPQGRTLRPELVEKVAKAAWFESKGTEAEPDKFVILVDTDGKDPDGVLAPLREELPSRLRGLGPDVLFAFAQWHLEAWFFADHAGLRRYLKRSLGRVGAESPDQITNPKLRLKHLLGDSVYTSRKSEEIAEALDPHVIRSQSPSFAGFVEAVRNGPE